MEKAFLLTGPLTYVKATTTGFTFKTGVNSWSVVSNQVQLGILAPLH